MSNHDFDRLATRLGAANVRAAATLLLTLPGTAFVYQGDEIGLANGPGADPPYDRAGRDPMRHPMQWDATPTGGFTTGVPWLPAVDPAERNVEAQRDDRDSLLHDYRRLIGRDSIMGRLLMKSPPIDELDAGVTTMDYHLCGTLDQLESKLAALDPDVLAYERGDDVIATETKPG